jgi:hypothetical protein
MAWFALSLASAVGLLIVWVASDESRIARVVGSAAVLILVLMVILSRDLAPTSTWTWAVGLTVIISQATVVGIVSLWIASRQSRVGRMVGGFLLAILAIGLTYGIIVGPMWKLNALTIATITFMWVLGRQRRRTKEC